MYIDPHEWGTDHLVWYVQSFCRLPPIYLSYYLCCFRLRWLPANSALLYEFTRIRFLLTAESFMQSFSTLPRMESLILLSFDYCDDWKARFSFP